MSKFTGTTLVICAWLAYLSNANQFVDANLSAQLKRAIHQNAKANIVEYIEWDCKMQIFEQTKFIGQQSVVAYGVNNSAICASVCWQFKSNGGKCESANYLSGMNKCELLENALDIKNSSAMANNVKKDASMTYVIPQSCKKPTGAGPQPTPAPTQAPTAAPKPTTVAPTSQPGAGGIKPGSCGQTSVEPRLSRSLSSLRKPGYQRIVGGIEAKPHSLPWTISMQGLQHGCGATLLRVSNTAEESDIVITAAHCIFRGRCDKTWLGGAHSFSRPDKYTERIATQKCVVHEGYNPNVNLANDIAIIKLAKPFKFNEHVQPVCLPKQGVDAPSGAMGIVAGWGYTNESGIGGTTDALMQVAVPVVEPKQCNYLYGNGLVVQAMLCAGFLDGQKDSCQGDSGGPYILKEQNGYTLHGVVSFGAGCARPKLPGVYARVSNYVDWINQKIMALTSVRT